MAIDRKEIVDAALQLLNEAGIDKLSTRALAARLGVAQPALYWHFRNKNDLLDAVNTEMLARYRASRVPRRGEAWDAYTLAKARSFRKALLAVRDGARVNAGTRPGQGEFAEFEQQLALYVDAGFSPESALHVSIAVARYVLGFVLEEQGERQRTDDRDQDHDPMNQVAAFPLLATGVKALMAGGSINTDSAFEAGLNYMVAGMRMSLGKTASSRGGHASPAHKQKRRLTAPLKT